MKPTAEFIQRLIKFYNLYKDAVKPSDMWEFNIIRFHAHLANALIAKDEIKVRQYLDNFASFGVSGMEDPASVPFASNHFQGKLIELGEIAGVIPIQNPEQPFERHINPDELSRQIATRLGYGLTMPSFIGFKCDMHGVPIRFMNYAAAVCLCDLLLNGLSDLAVCEIGPGLGFMGYILLQKRAKEYHTIDLPTTSVVFAYAATHWLDESQIWLCGEGANEKAFMRVWPCGEMGSIGAKFHLIFNSDSLPEMTQAQQCAYYDFIKNQSQFFVSVNQETTKLNQLRVLDGARTAGLVLRARHPFPMRTGYVFEAYTAFDSVNEPLIH